MAKPKSAAKTDGRPVPEFDRLNYFYGQMLSAGDFRTEQTYFREKLKLHNRCLHGYGTVCGLKVVPAAEAPECEGDPEKPEIVVLPGLALDAEGNELVRRPDDQPMKYDVWELLSESDRKQVGARAEAGEEISLWVVLHYSQCGYGTSRPIVPDPCGATIPDEFGRIREGVRVSVSLEEPKHDDRCETCCAGPCPHSGLVLARIDCFNYEKAIDKENIHNEVRRLVSTYQFTTITGVNWRHGSDRTHHATGELLKHGLIIRFSRPVWKDTLRRGVIDVYHIESRSTRNPNVIELRGEIDPGHTPDASCPEYMTRKVRYHFPELEECPEHDDRILVVVRCEFILDKCCRPVDGLNVGGRVHYVEDDDPHPGGQHPAAPYHHCHQPPGGYGPWVTGNGAGGGTFESWFYVEGRKKEDRWRS